MSSRVLVSHYLNYAGVTLGNLNSVSSVEQLYAKEAFRLFDAHSSQLLKVLFISVENLDSNFSFSFLISEFQSS